MPEFIEIMDVDGNLRTIRTSSIMMVEHCRVTEENAGEELPLGCILYLDRNPRFSDTVYCHTFYDTVILKMGISS